MFSVSNAGENSGETYKLSSDVEAYIFVPLKSPRAGFLMRHFAESSNIAKPSILLYPAMFSSARKCKVVGVCHCMGSEGHTPGQGAMMACQKTLLCC